MKNSTKGSARGCKKIGRSIKKVILVDRFSEPVKLNVNGATEIKSGPGAIVTIFLLIVLAAYAGQKF